MAKKFTGSWVILILLLLCTVVGGLIYFFVKYEEVKDEGLKRMCMNCGQQVGVQFSVCPFCQQPTTRAQTTHAGQSHDVRPPQQSY